MAAGDIIWFRQGLLDLGKKLHDLSADALKLGLITAAATPVATSADPRWGAGGTTNFLTNQVAVATAYVTGGPSLANVSWALQSNQPELRADIVTIAQDPGGFTNARWGIIYNNTDAGKRCLAFVDLGSDRSIVGGPLVIDWNGASNIILNIGGA
jgi:hypothetical protein